jgi:hypothetical protein
MKKVILFSFFLIPFLIVLYSFSFLRFSTYALFNNPSEFLSNKVNFKISWVKNILNEKISPTKKAFSFDEALTDNLSNKERSQYLLFNGQYKSAYKNSITPYTFFWKKSKCLISTLAKQDKHLECMNPTPLEVENDSLYKNDAERINLHQAIASLEGKAPGNTMFTMLNSFPHGGGDIRWSKDKKKLFISDKSKGLLKFNPNKSEKKLVFKRPGIQNFIILKDDSIVYAFNRSFLYHYQNGVHTAIDENWDPYSNITNISSFYLGSNTYIFVTIMHNYVPMLGRKSSRLYRRNNNDEFKIVNQLDQHFNQMSTLSSYAYVEKDLLTLYLADAFWGKSQVITTDHSFNLISTQFIDDRGGAVLQLNPQKEFLIGPGGYSIHTTLLTSRPPIYLEGKHKLNTMLSHYKSIQGIYSKEESIKRQHINITTIEKGDLNNDNCDDLIIGTSGSDEKYLFPNYIAINIKKGKSCTDEYQFSSEVFGYLKFLPMSSALIVDIDGDNHKDIIASFHGPWPKSNFTTVILRYENK